MSQHDKHLPRKNLNKTAGHGAQPAGPETLANVARRQGQGTKDDAKAARAARRRGR